MTLTRILGLAAAASVAMAASAQARDQIRQRNLEREGDRRDKLVVTVSLHVRRDDLAAEDVLLVVVGVAQTFYDLIDRRWIGCRGLQRATAVKKNRPCDRQCSQ